MSSAADNWRKREPVTMPPTPPDQPVEAAKDSVCGTSCFISDEVIADDCTPDGCPACKSLEFQKTQRQPKDPAAQTPDRTEGEGPYKVVMRDSKMFLVGGIYGDGGVWLDQWCFDDFAKVANAVHLAGQASTQQGTYEAGKGIGRLEVLLDGSVADPRIQHLERIEVAAKQLAIDAGELAETVGVYGVATTSPSSIQRRAKSVRKSIRSLAALLDDEGDSAK